MTLPDVAYVVTQLSSFLENPDKQNQKTAIRVLRYLKTTKTTKLPTMAVLARCMLQHARTQTRKVTSTIDAQSQGQW